MNAKTTTRTLTVAAVLVTATSFAFGAGNAPAAQDGARPGLNRMEHEAHRYLGEIRKEQTRALNPREHLAHRDVDERVTIVKPGEHLGRKPTTTASATVTPAACSAALANAWQRLGHYSDGYERYLLRHAPCA
jgi:hypothetical protein